MVQGLCRGSAKAIAGEAEREDGDGTSLVVMRGQ